MRGSRELAETVRPRVSPLRSPSRRVGNDEAAIDWQTRGDRAPSTTTRQGFAELAKPPCLALLPSARGGEQVVESCTSTQLPSAAATAQARP
jgi:hypothetical protein